MEWSFSAETSEWRKTNRCVYLLRTVWAFSVVNVQSGFCWKKSMTLLSLSLIWTLSNNLYTQQLHGWIMNVFVVIWICSFLVSMDCCIVKNICKHLLQVDMIYSWLPFSCCLCVFHDCCGSFYLIVVLVLWPCHCESLRICQVIILCSFFWECLENWNLASFFFWPEKIAYQFLQSLCLTGQIQFLRRCLHIVCKVGK